MGVRVLPRCLICGAPTDHQAICRAQVGGAIVRWQVNGVVCQTCEEVINHGLEMLGYACQGNHATSGGVRPQPGGVRP